MQYRDFKGEQLSWLGMGNMRLPVDKSKVTRPIDYEAGQQIIDYAMEHGVNYYDTAYVYHKGGSEDFLGHALAKYPRDSYNLATKYFLGGGGTPKMVFEKQLKKLNTDYIDFYLIHSIMDLTFKQYIRTGAVDYFMEQKRLGRIRHLGFSSHAKPKNLRKFAQHHDWDFVQLQINYNDWVYGTAREEYEIACEMGLPVIVMEPVKGGTLASLNNNANDMLLQREPERSIPSWAMRFLMRLDNIKVVLSGMGTMEQICDNVATFAEGKPLDDDELNLLMNALQISHNKDVEPCTACRYCCDGCPEQIDIPEVISLYNRFRTEGRTAQEEVRARIAEMDAGPADCIACGACQKHCPQSIEIPQVMEAFAAKL